ncbi:Cholesterol 25-hydroxylase-like protein [Triplophysa tibetana]|uniref:Cholesterol 25-hydroxylase-like protein n=1 Tax=Triplophysa tibetana TaxID=1572043 RepID=A0A5A9P3X8_9TELE|nr:Cholesterol 25-hydroxylase-like protein [Triplophysa tibetana]KAA0717184.1 Cholesterol 25-hydroxylase-like protein [Triplophysa tibetana]
MIILVLLILGNDALLQWIWDFVYDKRHVFLMSPHWSVCAAFSAHIIFSAPFMILDLLSPHVRWLQKIPWLYQRVHRIHHLSRDTFALAAQDSSISELLSLQALAFISTMLVGCHPLSEILFHVFNTWMAVEDHCAYDFPWALHRLLPCFGGAPYHLAHHQRFIGNFAPYFRHWDCIFGTSLQIPKYK